MKDGKEPAKARSSRRPVSNTAEHNYASHCGADVGRPPGLSVLTVAFMGHAGAEGTELVELVGAGLGTLLAGRAPPHRLVDHHRAAAALGLGDRRGARVQALAVPEQGETVVPPRVCQHAPKSLAYIIPVTEYRWAVSDGIRR